MSNDTWFYARGNQQFGPVTLDVLRGLAQSGQLWPSDLVWVAGMTNWVEARLSPDLAAIYQAQASPTGAVAAPPPLAPPASPYIAPYYTPQPQLVYAGFWWRFLAYIIDIIITNVAAMLPGCIFGAITGFIMGASGMHVAGDEPIFSVVGIAAGVLTSWLYFALMESSSKQGTLGKMVLRLIVTDQEGRRLTFGHASGRFFAKFLSGIALGVGFFMAGFTERKQALHDMIAKTYVMRRL